MTLLALEGRDMRSSVDATILSRHSCTCQYTAGPDRIACRELVEWVELVGTAMIARLSLTARFGKPASLGRKSGVTRRMIPLP
jgi:hypothetical protein